MTQQARDYTKGVFLPAYDYAGGLKYGYITIRTADAADGNPQVILPSGTAPWKQKFYGAIISQGFVGGTGTAAGEPLALKRQGAGVLILEANVPVTRGDELIASEGTFGAVKPRTQHSGSCYVIGTAEESLSASSAVQKVEAYIEPYWVEADDNVIADPGSTKAIPVTASGFVPLTIAGAGETNTLADPTFVGQKLDIIADTLGGVGARAITAASAINQTGNTVMTFAAAQDFIRLVAVTIGGALKWRVAANDGVALS